MRILKFCLISFLLLLVISLKSDPIIITYPRPELETDVRYTYPIALLNVALNQSGNKYKIKPSTSVMLQIRAQKELMNEGGIDILWSMTSKEREIELLPIRIPIDKGLIGLRIFFINKNSKTNFENVKKVEDLKQLIAGQGRDWPDTKILKANGFKVEGVSLYDSLFLMLEANRIDFFPRSILEIWDEEKLYTKNNIIVESSLAIHYPTALYFFVNRSNTKLAATIEKGLQTMIANGSFDKILYQYHNDFIRKANLRSRRVFELTNPLLPQETPLSDRKLWFNRMK